MDKIEEVCHNCKSKDVFFDGELYKCIKCHYQWLPEVFPFPARVKIAGNNLFEEKKKSN